MHAHTPGDKDELKDCERRLASWRPAEQGLDADAMLFAAGLAAGRQGRGRLLWPAVCLLLAVQAVGLAAWGLRERAERRALANVLRQPSPTSNVPQTAPQDRVPPPSYTPSPGDYVSVRRLIEQDPNRWLASLASIDPQSPGAPPPEPFILRSHPREGLLDP
jgi:hypothetical protein